MAVDEAVLVGYREGYSPPTLRIYSFSHPAVTVGRFQRLTDGFIRRAESLGFAIVRRPTGGRAVLHGTDLAYSVVASVSDPLLGGSTKETYRKISETLASAFSRLGVVVNFEPTARSESYRTSVSCYNTTVLYELRAGKEKIAGSAQTRQGGAFLQQGTIALTGSRADHFELFGEGSRPPKGLSALLGRSITYNELAESIRESFGGSESDAVLNESELRSLEVFLSKYRSNTWNLFGRKLCDTISYSISQRQFKY